MRQSSLRIYCAALVASMFTACALFAWDAAELQASRLRSAEFQRLVAGLGFGPSVDLSRCEFSFDPRVNPHCDGLHTLLAGGASFCPHHAESVFDYPASSILEITSAR